MVLLILAGVYQNSEPVIEDGKIKRNAPGDGTVEYELLVGGEGIPENQRYSVRVEEKKLTEPEIKQVIEVAKNEIDKTFYQEDDTAEHVTSNVNLGTSYVNGKVAAEWYFNNYKLINTDGTLNSEEIPEDGEIVTAEVELTCDEVKELYSFAFHIYPRSLSEEEKIIKDINVAITTENNMKGTEYITLPKEANGVDLTWNVAKEHLVLKVLMLEIAGIVLLVLANKKQEEELLKKRQNSMRIDYAEIVSKMAILLGSGMSVKESWNRISARKSNKGPKNTVNCRPIYEEMQITIREIDDGVSERVAYQNFGERVGLGEYYRFVRLLISNMQKGNRSICTALEEEAISAYEQRRMLIKKLGEEAGTKLLIPLMIMLIIVMTIILVPAIMGF